VAELSAAQSVCAAPRSELSRLGAVVRARALCSLVLLPSVPAVVLMADKQSKQAVNYRTGRPSRRCGLCTMFIRLLPARSDGNGCTAVQGPINEDDVCNLFERKR
jgi:hypothetical protein